MRAWLRRLWAELRRDHLAEQARARELYQRTMDEHRWGGALRYDSEASKIVVLPPLEVPRKAELVARLNRRLAELRLESPEISPEGTEPESPKSL